MSDDILSLALGETGVDVLSTLDVSDSVEDPTSILNAAAGTIDNAVLASDISELTEELVSSLRNKPPVALLPITADGTMSILRGDVACPLEGDGFVGSFSPPNTHSTDGSHVKSLPDFDLKDLEDQLHLCQTTKISSPESLPFQSQASNPTPVTNTADLTTDDEVLDLVNTLKSSEYLESLIQSNTFDTSIPSYLPNSFPNTTALVTSSSSAPMYDVNAVIDQPRVSQPAQPSFTTTFPGLPPVDREWTGTQTITAAAEASQHQQLNWMDGPPAKVRKTMPIRSEAENTRPGGNEVRLHSMEGPFDSGDRQCSCCHRLHTEIDEIKRETDEIKRKVDMILDSVTANSRQTYYDEEDEYMENGVNLLCLPAKDAYSYGQALLDRLFTKEELGRSLVFPSDKSPKPGLPQEKVNKLFRCIHKRYGDKYDMKLMLTKLNQKCRDSGRSVIKQTLKQVPEGHVHESRPM